MWYTVKENIKTAIDFAQKIRELQSPNIFQVILFGSVARGEDRSDSDIDIAVIHDGKVLRDIIDIEKKIQPFISEKIQLTLVSLQQLPEETTLASALTGEGILLYGKPLQLQIKETEIVPKKLIVYDTTILEKKQRALLNRSLYGSISKSVHKGKEYRTETKGLLAEPGFEKMGRASVLAEPKQAAKLIAVLKRFGATYKQRLLYEPK